MFLGEIYSIRKEIFFEDDGTYSNIYDKYYIYNGIGTINYITENNTNVFHAYTSNSTIFYVGFKDCDITEQDNFILECDWKCTFYWDGGGLHFGNKRLIHFRPAGASDGLINYVCNTNVYFHVKVTYINKIVSLYINDSLIGTATNNDGDGSLILLIAGDTTSFHYYIKNLIIRGI